MHIYYSLLVDCYVFLWCILRYGMDFNQQRVLQLLAYMNIFFQEKNVKPAKIYFGIQIFKFLFILLMKENSLFAFKLLLILQSTDERKLFCVFKILFNSTVNERRLFVFKFLLILLQMQDTSFCIQIIV